MRKHFYTPALAAAAILFFQTLNAQNTSPYWSLAGNSNASSSPKLGTTNGVDLRLYTNNAERLRILSSNGNVGIGTTAPGAKLEVRSTSTGLLARFNGGSSKMYIGLYENSVQRGYLGSYAGNNQDIDFGTSSSNSTGSVHLTIKAVPKLTVTSTGQVGIGTTTPASGYQLHVVEGIYATNTNSNALSGFSTNAQGIYAASTNSWGGYMAGKQVGAYGTAYNTTSSGYGVYGYGYSSSTVGGDIAVGVYGTASSDNFRTSYGVYGQGGNNGVYGRSDADGGVGVEGYATGTNSYGVMAVSSQFIALYAYTGNSNAFAGYFLGKVYSSGGFTSSDRKLKENISDFSSAMNIISQLKPKTYTFRQDGNYKLMNLPQGKHFGLIAQDVEQILPELVANADFNTARVRPQSQPTPPAGAANANTTTAQTEATAVSDEVIEFKALNYTELIPIMVKGMQEQQQMVLEQSAEIQALHHENLAIKERLERLETLLANTGAPLTSASAYLEQNAPNPVRGATTIRYFVPETSTSAVLTVTNAKGQVVKTLSLGSRGAGQVRLNTSLLAAGTYNYTLHVNGRQADAKRLIVAQ